MSDLHLHIEDGYPPKMNKCFEYLSSALQPSSEISTDDIVTKLMDYLLPLAEFQNNVQEFFTFACEVSLQIPYDHPSMERLVSILDVFFGPTSLEKLRSLEIDTEDLFGMFNGEMTDWYHAIQSEPSVSNANGSSFLARIGVLGLPSRRFRPGGTRMALDGAFEKGHASKISDWGQGLVMAAAQWILITGGHVADYYFHPERHDPEDVAGRSYSLPKWREYRHGFEAFANGDRDEAEFAFSDESKSLAAQAAAEMLLLEQEAGVSETPSSQDDGSTPNAPQDDVDQGWVVLPLS